MRRVPLLPILTAALSATCLWAQAVSAQSIDDRIQPLPPVRRAVDMCPTLESLGYQQKAITNIELDITLRGDQLPEDCARGLFAAPMGWEMAAETELEFTWAASDLYHQPTYFSDPILERYGQAHHPLLQPVLSGAHFFGTFPIIPYKIGLNRTHDRVYTLGYYRPGSPTPCIGRRLPLEWDAAGFEAATWLALIFLLP